VVVRKANTEFVEIEPKGSPPDNATQAVKINIVCCCVAEIEPCWCKDFKFPHRLK
jgi:hypothetical protein